MAIANPATSPSALPPAHAEALTAPSDLWVLPLPAHSRWFARIDWYLNWQMCRGLAFERRKPAVELFRVMEESSLAYVESPSCLGRPLMVSSRGHVPAGKCLVLPAAASLTEWLTHAREVIAQLNTPRVRIFLPAGTTTLEANEIWHRFQSTDITTPEFSPDEDAP